jgi:hypothetical protein
MWKQEKTLKVSKDTNARGVISPEILIVSSRLDFASDYITQALVERGASYLRLNTDDLKNYDIFMNPLKGTIQGKLGDFEFSISPERLRTIYFRGPTFLRELSPTSYTPEEKVSRVQWASFIRGLMIFDNCRWVNHPMSTYRAESKPVQLALAQKLGFLVPNTVVTNSGNFEQGLANDQQTLILKSLETCLLEIEGKRGFVYTNVVREDEVRKSKLSLAPVILQELIEPKIDLRVTVVGNKVFAAEIFENKNGITGDWRLKKDSVEYVDCKLPEEIKSKCIKLVQELRLSYGAIDLARKGDDYYFIEINPTGEWAWLVERANQQIDQAIVDYLLATG